MEGKVGAGNTSAAPAEVAAGELGKTRAKSGHLMCGTAMWGVAGAVASAYFSYLSYSHLDTGALAAYLVQFLTYLVWMV